MNRSAAPQKVPFWKQDLGTLLSRHPKPGKTPPQVPADEPPLPVADLIPSAVRETIAARRARSVALLLALIVLTLATGMWTWWTAELNDKQGELATVKATNTTLQTEVTALTPVETLVRQVEAQTGLLQEARASQATSVVIIDRLRTAARTSGPVSLDSLSISFHPIPAPGEPLNPCPDPDPFGEEISIGCATFSASTDSRDSISRFLQTLEEDPLFVGPFVNTSSIASQVDTPTSERVTFSGSVGVSTEGLVTPLSAEEIEAIVNPPEETTETSDEVAEGGESQ